MTFNSSDSKAPIIKNIYYWQNKQQFLLKTDSYSDWILFMVEKGRFYYNIDRESGIAERGDIVFCSPHTIFERSAIETLTFFAITFTMPIFYSGITTSLASFKQGKRTLQDQQRFFSTLHQLKPIWQEREQPFLERKQYLIHDLLTIFIWEQEQQAVQKALPTDSLMKKAERYIQERALQKFKLKDLAYELGLSAVQFTRRFQSQYLATPGEYVTSIRMAKARNLLVQTDLTIEEIAQRCGYDNGFYFSRAFSSKTGVAPSIFRKNNHL